MKTNKIEPFNKSLPVSKVSVFDIRTMGNQLDFSLSLGDIKTSTSQQKIDMAVFTIPLELSDDKKNNLFAAVCVPVFPPSEINPDGIMVMAGKNTSRFFDVKFFVSDKPYSPSDVSGFEPSDEQSAIIDKRISEIESTILNGAATGNVEYAYAETIKGNVFEKNNVEFFKSDLFKFSPISSSFDNETKAALDHEVFLSKRNLSQSSNLEM